LLQVWGLPGLAVAVPLAYVFYALLMLPVTHKLVGHRWSREVGQLLGWSALFVAAGFAANRLLPPAAAVLCGAALAVAGSVFCLRGLAARVGAEHKLVRLISSIPGGRLLFGEKLKTEKLKSEG
jgi:hypothetical protein